MSTFFYTLKNCLLASTLAILFSSIITIDSHAGCIYSKPIEASELKMGNMVSWSTSEENNNEFFVIQKSVDGIEYTTVGQIKGAGSSKEEQHYRYLDFSTGETRVFYRLMQVDFDGITYQTPTVILNRNNENNFIITAMSSTMTDSEFSLTLRSEKREKVAYKILDLNDQLMKNGEAEVVNGVNVISVNIDGLSVGSYQLVIEGNKEDESVYVRKVDSKDMPNISYALKE